jgi:methionyl-tRNA synthetase
VAGAYLPADIYVRYLRLAGEETLFICGTDEHGTPVTISADEEGVKPSDIVKRYHDDQDRAFKALDIQFDIYSGTSTCSHHAGLAQEFFTRLFEKGDIEPKDTEQYFCTVDGRFLPDRYVVGTCPRCANPEARGDQCEKCGSPMRANLVEPRCKLCDNPPELRTTRHWFFKLDHYTDALNAWLDSREGWREQCLSEARKFTTDLKSRAITRDLSWGIDVPLKEAEGKKLYVWFDAPIGYVSFTKELGEQRGDPDLWKRWWLDQETRLVHFIGKDNIVFHAVIFPAMLQGLGDYCLPYDVPGSPRAPTAAAPSMRR